MRVFLLITAVVLASCQPTEKPEEVPEENILENLPISDRDLLLAPLESAYNDLREVAENDPSLTSISQDFDSTGYVVSESYKLDESDTVVRHQVVERKTRVEKRSWYWDGRGNMYYSSARIKSLDESGNTLEVRAYQFYFEDDGSLLSGYGKSAFHGKKLPSVWTPVCLTQEEEDYLFGF